MSHLLLMSADTAKWDRFSHRLLCCVNKKGCVVEAHWWKGDTLQLCREEIRQRLIVGWELAANPVLGDLRTPLKDLPSARAKVQLALCRWLPFSWEGLASYSLQEDERFCRPHSPYCARQDSESTLLSNASQSTWTLGAVKDKGPLIRSIECHRPTGSLAYYWVPSLRHHPSVLGHRFYLT